MKKEKETIMEETENAELSTLFAEITKTFVKAVEGAGVDSDRYICIPQIRSFDEIHDKVKSTLDDETSYRVIKKIAYVENLFAEFAETLGGLNTESLTQSKKDNLKQMFADFAKKNTVILENIKETWLDEVGVSEGEVLADVVSQMLKESSLEEKKEFFKKLELMDSYAFRLALKNTSK